MSGIAAPHPWLSLASGFELLVGVALGAIATAWHGIVLVRGLRASDEDEYQEQDEGENPVLTSIQIEALEKVRSINEKTWKIERAMLIEALKQFGRQ